MSVWLKTRGPVRRNKMSGSFIDQAAHLSPWRNRPLAEKSLFCLGMLGLAVALPPLPGALLVGGVVLPATFFWARVPLRVWLQAAALPMGFLLTGAAALLVELGPDGIAFSATGAAQAGLLVLRALAALSCLLLLSLTTPVSDLLVGLRRIGLPREIVEIALLTYRFTFLISDAAMAMNHAQIARQGRSSYRRWLRGLGMLIANLLPRALDRARRLEAGLAARGWEGEMRVLRDMPRASATVLAAILGLEAAIATAGVLL